MNSFVTLIDSAPDDKTIGTMTALTSMANMAGMSIGPALTGILPWLTPLAALGLIIVLLSAIVFHIRRGEFRSIILNLILLLGSAFVVIELWLAVPVW